MATKQYYQLGEIKEGSCFSPIKAIVETAFYGNNVYPVETPKEAYKLAVNSPGTVVTDMEIYEPEKNGLPAGAKVLLFNDGGVHGRCAAARRILGEPGVTVAKYSPILRDAIYNTRNKKMYRTSAYVGLSPEFMVKAHLCIPEGEENIMLSWLLNFQYCNEVYNEMYAKYAEEAAKMPNLILGGRLGAYRYWDMDKAIADALNVFETRILATA